MSPPDHRPHSAQPLPDRPVQVERAPEETRIEAGPHLVVLADPTRWGIVGIGSGTRLQEAETIITETGFEPAALRQIVTSVRKLILVDVAKGERRTIVGDTQDGHSPHEPMPGRRW